MPRPQDADVGETKEPAALDQGSAGRSLRGPALCLSGGGYRAMLFHTGVLWRLHETGLLFSLDRVSSVSGGSITAGVLALAWPCLTADRSRSVTTFVNEVVKPLRALADKTIDIAAALGGVFVPGTRSGDRIAAAYDDHLFHGATLQDLPSHPRFVINATNVQSGALWRFSKPYMRDYRVGEVPTPAVPLARAVAASSAFPPLLSPVELLLDPTSFTPGSGDDLQRDPFTRRVFLTDGGVYDNLGLETAKSFECVFVSDAGGKMKAVESPKGDWLRHTYRVLNVIDNQVRSRRKIELMESFKNGTRSGAFWGIRTDIAKYNLPDALPCPRARTTELADIGTRLKRLEGPMQERLINWGYAVCDAALRAHVDATLPVPRTFPYSTSGV